MKKITKLVLIALLSVAISCSEDEPATPQKEPQKIENVGTSNTEKPKEEPKEEQKEEPTTTPTEQEPTTPTTPTEPTEPSEPTEPTEPVTPTEPTEPSEPTEPTEPSEPSDEDILKRIVLSADKKTLISYPNDVDRLVIPESVEKIGDVAFRDNYYLKEIILPNGIVEIGNAAFLNSSITKVVLPEGLTKIGQSAFKSCSELESIVIPSTVTSIGDWAISFCSNLKSITIKAPYEVGSDLFEYADNEPRPQAKVYVSESDYYDYLDRFEDYENLTFVKY